MKHLLLLGAILSASANLAQAGFLPSFTGYTQFGFDENGTAAPRADGIVNFAVYKNTDGNWTDDFAGVGLTPLIGPVDAAANYVYLYQVVNTDPTPPDAILHQFDVTTGGGFTSGGYVTGRVFNDGAAVGPSGNVKIGSEAAVASDLLDGAPSLNGQSLAGTPFTSLSGTRPPTALTFEPDAAQFFFPGAAGISTNQFSPVLFLTSAYQPVYKAGFLHDTQISAGDIPVPAPEPASLLVWAGAFGIGAVFMLSRRRKLA